MTINDQNLEAMGLISRLLQADQPLFSAEEVRAFARDTGLSAHQAFCMLIAAACGLKMDEDPDHRELAQRYLFPALRRLDPAAYMRNPYYQLLQGAALRQGAWTLTRQSYAPWRIFPCGNTTLLSDGRTLPQLGYFETTFSYPALLENGREWMTVTPNEIETMAADIAAAHGRTAVLGLGLGYYAYMISNKPEVESVTVAERSADVIRLFRSHLLPLFPHREKIRLVQSDAFDFIGNGTFAYDFVYADLWHSVADGLPLYLRLKDQARGLGGEWRFWIEPDMLIFLGGLAADPAARGNP
ncbi:MAG: hypothetical protein IJ157_03165 [Clostridia bacterium]|nr:hypothetical protein [Clostridia bacterium]